MRAPAALLWEHADYWVALTLVKVCLTAEIWLKPPVLNTSEAQAVYGGIVAKQQIRHSWRSPQANWTRNPVKSNKKQTGFPPEPQRVLTSG